jgi:hypothetical protein
MPLYVVTPSFDAGVADGDMTNADLQMQGKQKVRYRGYWVDVGGGKVLCLVEAPSASRPGTFWPPRVSPCRLR